jgi:UDP-glucose 4-epimerase
MRILITGSSGQIGTNLALRLQAEGHAVIGVDRRENIWTDAFPYLIQDLACRADDGRTGIAECPPPDVVVHLAAHAKVHELVLCPERALENMIMTFNILEYCRGLHVPILFSSSREVYGNTRHVRTAEGAADFANAESPYSASKITGEALLYSYARCYGLSYIAFRLSNVYGRFDCDLERMERVIPLFIRRIARDEAVTIYGPEKVLDFTYVDDCVEGLIRGIHALVSGRVRNETFNLACGQGHTLVRMAELVGAALGRTPRLHLAPSLVGEVTHYVADIRRSGELLGFQPRVPLEAGIGRAVAWWREWSLRSPSLRSATGRRGQRGDRATESVAGHHA